VSHPEAFVCPSSGLDSIVENSRAENVIACTFILFCQLELVEHDCTIPMQKSPRHCISERESQMQSSSTSSGRKKSVSMKKKNSITLRAPLQQKKRSKNLASFGAPAKVRTHGIRVVPRRTPQMRIPRYLPHHRIAQICWPDRRGSYRREAAYATTNPSCHPRPHRDRTVRASEGPKAPHELLRRA
jgi:hypothetical protein